MRTIYYFLGSLAALDHKSLDDLAAGRRSSDLLDVLDSNAPVRDVVRLCHDANAGFAEIQTARGARPHLLGGAEIDERFLELCDDRIGAFFCAGALGMTFWAAIRAHEEVVVAMRHTLRTLAICERGVKSIGDAEP